MKPFEYKKPENITTTLANTSITSKFIAGGTNLLDLMKKHIHEPDTVLDVTQALPNTIEKTNNGISIGAMVRNVDIANNSVVKKEYPILAKAILKGASPQIRNMASTGGNILQRTRCPYFYDTTMPCNKRKNGSGCSAKNGHNRMGAVVGYSENCVAVHPSDMCIALAALDAQVEILNKDNSKQTIDFADFHRLPENNPERDTTLPPNALITAISIPKNNFHKNWDYVKLRDRESYAFALVSVAAAFELEKNTIIDVRLASGGVAHKPWRWAEAERFLQGKQATTDNFTKAAEIAITTTTPLPQTEFKIPLLRGAIVTALQNCLTNS